MNGSTRAGIARGLRALLLPILLGVGAAVAGLLVVRQAVPVALLRESNDVVGNYLQTLGTIFAVLLAFVVFVVWSQFNDARQRVESEANELLNLARTARGLTGHTCESFHDHLREYLRVVLGPEWEAMGRRDATGFDPGWDSLELVWDHLSRIEPESDREQTLYSELLARFNDLSDARTARLSSATMTIPLGLKLLLYFGALVTIGSMYLFAVESPVVHLLVVAALAGSISHVLYLISDLDDCFRGQFQVPRTPFDRVSRYLDNHPVENSAQTASTRARSAAGE